MLRDPLSSLPISNNSLGLTYNLVTQFDKAISCFQVAPPLSNDCCPELQGALTQQPDDYALWNKLGATLTNSDGKERFHEAVDAFTRALEGLFSLLACLFATCLESDLRPHVSQLDQPIREPESISG